ncbi:MAG: TIGR03619 family F420-dependent LLM class oxidoreductase [Alphaproteobacteria bacterium]|jgi:alkanesulfonate monooxygenase|nr:MAG: Limonene 1,2-monooxygenase [Alphaproteobacteria bacterium MarineAlpha9_Bin6]
MTSKIIGIAMQNFTAAPEMPDAAALIDYSVRVEQLGYESIWVWDHILLGVDPYFPILDSLSILTAVAARTERIRLGTGVLVLPARNPVLLAKQLSSIDQISNGRLTLGLASGWYKREFDAIGVPFNKRGNIMDQNLDILTRLWQEDSVTGSYPPYELAEAVMSPKPVQKPRPPILIGGYVDRVLKRAGVVGDGWLTYYYTVEGFAKSWDKVRQFAEEAGKDPDTLRSINQLPIYIGKSRDDVKDLMQEWLTTEWDFAGWSDSTAASAVIGTVDDCIEQLQAHLDVGVQQITLVPYRFDREQIEQIAEEIIPRIG